MNVGGNHKAAGSLALLFEAVIEPQPNGTVVNLSPSWHYIIGCPKFRSCHCTSSLLSSHGLYVTVSHGVMCGDPVGSTSKHAGNEQR